MRTYRHSQLILGSALFGMIVLVGGQMIVEQVFVYAVPVSVFITVGGGIYFLYLLLEKRRCQTVKISGTEERIMTGKPWWIPYPLRIIRER